MPHRRRLGQPRIAISYAISPAAHGEGLGREAVSAVLGCALTLGVSEVEARTHHGNEASARLLLAVGFIELEASVAPPRRVFAWTGAR